MKALLIILFFHLSVFYSSNAQNTVVVKKICSINNLVAYWDFSEKEGEAKVSKGNYVCSLKEYGSTPIKVIKDGPLSGKSILLTGDNFLSLSHNETGDLNIRNNQVTVIAWVKWTGEQTGFVGGMWNEHEDGGKRQYGLFVSLPHYNGKNQVCGHISKTGKPTPPFPYSIDYSASKQTVTPEKWCCIAFTYDGKYIKSYMNGVFEPRAPELINHTTGFAGYPNGLTVSKNPYYFPAGMGNAGSDFTVGAVLLKSGMGNYFKGQIGGLAVYNRALTTAELDKLNDISSKQSTK